MPFSTPESEIEARIRRFQELLEKDGLDAALVLQSSDLFYLAGTIQQSHLYVPVEGDPVLMARKDYERARSESPIERTVPIQSSRQLPELLRRHGYELPRRLGMELDVLPANLYLGYRQIFDQGEILDVSPRIRTLRSVKSGYELDLIAEAAHFSDQVAAAVTEFLHEGITEIELAGRVEARARKLGHQGVIRMRRWGGEMFYGHLMAGPSAAVPSFLASPTGGAAVSPAVAQGPSFRPIGRREPVLMDYVFAHRGYLSDHTRIFAIGGLAQDLLDAHQAMLDVQDEIKKAARPGEKAGDIYDQAVKRATQLGYAENFMGVGEQRIRFIGHGVGIELDEFPFLAQGQETVLQEGMVIALEPKLIFPGIGVVGVENTHVVTASGLRQLGRFPDQVTIV